MEASSAAGMQSLEVLVDGQRDAYASEPCAVDDDGCAEEMVYELETTQLATGPHTVRVVATDTTGRTRAYELQVETDPQADNLADPTETPAPVEGSGPGCAVFDPSTQEEGVVLVVNGSWVGGGETTEYFSEDAYRVTRCNANGSLNERQSIIVERVDGYGDVDVLNELLRPTPPGSADDVVGANPAYAPMPEDPEGAVAWAEGVDYPAVIPPTPATEPLPTGQSFAAEGACSDRSFVIHRAQGRQPIRWHQNAHYRINRSSLPGTRAKRRIINGHVAWNKTKDRCDPDLANDTDFRMVFDGLTQDGAGTHGDGNSVVDFGDLGTSHWGGLWLGVHLWLRNPSLQASRLRRRWSPRSDGHRGIGYAIPVRRSTPQVVVQGHAPTTSE